MAKNRRNYNQDHFKVGGSAQPGDDIVHEQEDAKLGQQRSRTRSDAPEGAPGAERDAE